MDQSKLTAYVKKLDDPEREAFLLDYVKRINMPIEDAQRFIDWVVRVNIEVELSEMFFEGLVELHYKNGIQKGRFTAKGLELQKQSASMLASEDEEPSLSDERLEELAKRLLDANMVLSGGTGKTFIHEAAALAGISSDDIYSVLDYCERRGWIKPPKEKK